MATERERRLRRARALAARDRYDDALADYWVLCHDGPFDPELWLERAAVAEAAGMMEDAVRALFHVVELYDRTGMAEAVEVAQRVLALDPRHRGARHFLGQRAPDRLSESDASAAPVAAPVVIPRFDSVPIAIPIADSLPMPGPVSQSVALPRPLVDPLSGPHAAPHARPETAADPGADPQAEEAEAGAPDGPPGARTRRLVHDLLRGLHASPLVDELGTEGLALLADAGRMVRFARGQTVFREGEAGSSLYLILQGRVDVERLQPISGTMVRLSTLPAGAFFGEVSLVAGVPRSATVRAREPAVLLEVSRQAMRALGEQNQRLLVLLMRFFRARLVGTLVATSPLFQPFSPEERRAMVRRLRLRELAPNEIAVRQGRVGDGLYVVLIGTLIVFVSDDQGNARKLGVLGPGDVFGEMSLIHGERAMANIGTLARAWLLRLPREDFDELAAAHPEMRDRIARIAADRQARNRGILPR